MNRTRTSKNAKRLLVWLLLLTMVFGLLPMAAFADEAVVEPVVEEPVQETEPSSEPTEAPSEPTQEPETISELEQPGNADVTIEGDEEQSEDDTDAEDEITTLSTDTLENFKYSIVMVDCGRKYYSVENINAIIDSASAAGMHYVMLAVGNNGMRFLLDDMSLTVGGKTYTHDEVSKAIHNGNLKYDADTSKTKGQVYDPYTKGDTTNKDVEELTQNDMNAIMRHANDKGVQIIPLINTPGHMGAILSAATELTEVNCAYNSSVTTIDLSNSTALEFTKALLQKYITYFKDKGCTMFNMGSDEYANDSGSPSFNTSMYGNFITYINDVAQMILNAGMTPMAFNDGIYYDYTNRGDSYGTIDTRIIVCYWSPGWGGYDLAKVNDLINKGFKVINTHGGYYWIVGGNKCTADTAKNFDPSVFNDKQTVTGDNTKNIAGAMFCIWGDEPGSQASSSVPNEVSSVIKSFGNTLPATEAGSEHKNLNDTTPGGSESGGGSTGGGTEETGEVVKVTVAVGEPYTDTINGDVRDTFKQCEDTSVATASVEHTKVEGKTVKTLDELISSKDNGTYTGVLTDDGTNFMVVDSNGNISNTTDINAATEFKVVKAGSRSKTYTISVVGTTDLYLAIERGFDYNNWEYKYSLVTTTTSTSWTYVSNNNSSGFYNNYRYVVYSAGGWTVAQSGSSKLYTVKPTTTDPVDATVITIKGVAEGSTTCKLGNKTYEITVTEEDLTKVTPLKLEYWITNGRVTVSDTDTTNYASVPATAEGVATDMGIDVSSVTIDKGRKEKRDVYYWRCRLLDTSLENNSKSGTEQQTEESGDDDTTNGIGFTRIRYYNGVWSVFTENSEWVNVESKHQLVAYYREYIKVTDEVESYAADWGKKGDGSTSGDYLEPENVNTISYQVVYQDGNTNPAGTTADDLKSKTICYGYWAAGRGIGTIMLDETSNYEIYKVTAETGAMEGDGETWGSYTVSKFTWDDNETTVWTEADGKASDGSVIIQNNSNYPSKEGFYENLQWDENYESILIRIYVRAKVTSDSLTVHYVDKSTNTDFYSYNIVVANETYFDPQFAKVGNELTGNTVKNIDNQTQTVQSDITKMPEIGAQYRFAIYTFDVAKRSEDGKEVFLYYTFTRSKTFVIDFGLPLVIQPEDLNTELKGANIITTEATDSTSYATITVADKAVKYALKETLDKNDIFWIKYTGKNLTTSDVGEIEFTVEIIPASNVYYEDGFAKFVSGKNTASKAKWEVVGKETTAYQALSELGDKNIYGYDAAYVNSTEYSMGSAHKVTVTSAMRDGWNELSAWPTATFSFKGTGFDVISLTNNTSGAILVDVYNSENEKVKGYFVDNYFGYGKNDDGKWVEMPTSEEGKNNILYQIPVIKVSDLDYGNYNVTITVFYNDAFEHNGDSSYDFWLDAIRVYEPLGPSGNESYKKDDEGYPQYIRLRDEIAKDNGSVGTGTLFIEGKGNAKVAEYTNLGPNNEVYLADGQAISFKLSPNEKIANVQIGAKAPAGATGITVNNDENVVAISSATEMYYDITAVAKAGQVTITNNTGNILSLTNIKVTFSADSKVTLVALDDAAKENAVEIVRTLFAAPVVEPEKTFEPSRFKATWSKNVRAGERAVLTVKTSEDVESITVNGVPVTTYKTRTERTGWGRNALRVTYREFTYMISDAQNADYTVIAVNAEGTSSAPQIASLNVIPARPTRPGWGWLEDLFGRWF